MTRKYAILLDGGFVTKRLRARLGRHPSADEVILECERVAKLPEFASDVLLRIYYYDAPPYDGSIKDPWTGKSTSMSGAVHAQRTSFIQTLELKANVAIRMGECSAHGWRVKDSAIKTLAKTGRALVSTDLVPSIQQKGVDLRLGLDIARLSLRHLVDSIVIMTGDSDMIPAFKFARREGIRVYLDHLGGPVKRDLKVHVDVVL